MAKRVKRGTGITERESIALDMQTPADMEPLYDAADRMEARLGREPDAYDWIAGGIEEWATEVLASEPSDTGADTPHDYACRIMTSIGRTRYLIEKGDAAKAAHEAVRLGEMMAEIRIKGLWELHALRGRKTHDGARKGHATVHGTEQEKNERYAEYQGAVDEIHERNPRLSYQAIRQRVAVRYGVSESTIKRHTTNPAKK